MATCNATAKVISLTERQIRDSIEKLAALKSQIRSLKRQEEFLSDLIKDQGAGKYLGTKHIATVTESIRDTLDTFTVKSFLSDEQLMLATVRTPVVSLVIREV